MLSNRNQFNVSNKEFSLRICSDEIQSGNELVVDVREDNDAQSVKYSVWVSFAEIYNKKSFDLLEPGNPDAKKNLYILGKTTIGKYF